MVPEGCFSMISVHSVLFVEIPFY
ncbi:hypothetical protein CGLO_18303 [Colletotrichum gloeosporioides Cg-14]|uniref:Uncharacterized protein n=1 Tax=Colletotrichum gloeosporioides (strain Cg-14) TaxID=1237896 RepID=T0JUT0_COLGC|nr:hypothetical protein CGLO_18303 [Colletotrichum gloeosporioides Cg-14]